MCVCFASTSSFTNNVLKKNSIFFHYFFDIFRRYLYLLSSTSPFIKRNIFYFSNVRDLLLSISIFSPALSLNKTALFSLSIHFSLFQPSNIFIYPFPFKFKGLMIYYFPCLGKKVVKQFEEITRNPFIFPCILPSGRITFSSFDYWL